MDDTYAILPTHIKPRRIQPGKRTILVSVLLSLMLLISQLLRALQLEHPPQLTNVHVLQELTSLSEELEVPPCIKTHLGTSHSQASSDHSCHHLPAPRGLCSLLQTLFFKSKPQTCQHQPRVIFCNSVSGHISCETPRLCATLQHFVGIFDDSVGRTKWKQIEVSDLKKTVETEVTKENYYGFLFIKCANFSMDELEQPLDPEVYSDNSISYTQLFLYPKKYKRITENSVTGGNININLVMIDSLSRPHFYRSLPKTVTYFEDLYERSHPEVFDFQFFQAVKQRTYESLQALFSGYVNTTEVPFGTYDTPRRPLPVSHILRYYKEKSYKTLWLEDLCWNWEWGLVKDLKVLNNSHSDVSWQMFKNALEKANIDSVDITLASCDILDANGKKDPFHDLPAVCFNHQYHHEYLLEYLQLYQEAAQNAKQPFVTFSVTDVAHDETGIRVQTLDDALLKYMKFATSLNNTITILFSDHGSTYGNFMQASPEAYAEIFNPFLFLIVPKDIQDNLGSVQMKILKDNEKSLVSLIDVNNMLLQLINQESKIQDVDFVEHYTIPGGLLSSISPQRTCKDIPLLQPNMCICRNFETVVEPTEFHMILADFGLGVMNNIILLQNQKSGGVGFGNCRPLQGVKIRKVHETRVSVDLIRYNIDVVVQSTQEKSAEKQELFFLTVEAANNRNALRLVSFQRMSLYGIYARCADNHVELKLCICHTVNQKHDNGLLSSMIFGNLIPRFSFFRNRNTYSSSFITDFLSQPIFNVKPRIDIAYPFDDPCLFTIIHSYKSGIVLYAANFCLVHHRLEIVMETENLNLSCEKKPLYVLKPSDVKMLLAGAVANPKRMWHWSHNVKVQ